MQTAHCLVEAFFIGNRVLLARPILDHGTGLRQNPPRPLPQQRIGHCHTPAFEWQIYRRITHGSLQGFDPYQRTPCLQAETRVQRDTLARINGMSVMVAG
ncbi:hypothetical protein D3C81_868520 [compost metagenome]